MSRNRFWHGVLGCALALSGACGGDNADGDQPAPAGQAQMQAGAGANQPTAGMMSGAGTTGGNAGRGMAGTGSAGTGNAGGMSGGGAGSTSMAGTTGGGGTGANLMCMTQEVKEGMCKDNSTGVFAIKVVADVWWQDDQMPAIVDAGRAPLTVYLKGELKDVCPDGSNGMGVIKGCGTELPAFRSDANCEAFQIELPNELWDKPTMPTFTTTGSTTGFNPDDVLTLATATGLVGIDLMNENGTWPTPDQTGTFPCAAGTGMACFPDDDGDGKPGITIRMGKIGERFGTDMCGAGTQFTFRGAPLDLLSALDPNSVRGNILQIGLRTRLGGSGKIAADCKSGVGDSVAENLDSRVFDCQRTDDMPCDAAQAEFVDNQAPNYRILAKGDKPPAIPVNGSSDTLVDQTPSVGTRSAIVRLGNLGENFDCAAVRGAPFPAL